MIHTVPLKSLGTVTQFCVNGYCSIFVKPAELTLKADI